MRVRRPLCRPSQEFGSLLDTLKLSHKLAREQLPELDSWERMMAETNEATSLVTYDDRISRHVSFFFLSSLPFPCPCMRSAPVH